MSNESEIYEVPIRGEIESWYEISTQEPDICLDGVTAEDLKSIVENLKIYFSFDRLVELEDLLLKHLVNTENPHEVDMSNLDITILDELYKYWLSRNYKGTKLQLLDIIFRYIQYATLEDQILGESEELVPPVKVVYDFFKLHDIDLDAHHLLFQNIFLGDAQLNREPFFSVHFLTGYPKNFIQNDYQNISFSASMNNDYSVFPLTCLLRGKEFPIQNPLISLNDETSSIYIKLFSNKLVIFNDIVETIDIEPFNDLTTNPRNILVTFENKKINIYYADATDYTLITNSYDYLTEINSKNLTHFQLPKTFYRDSYNGIVMYNKLFIEDEIMSLVL